MPCPSAARRWGVAWGSLAAAALGGLLVVGGADPAGAHATLIGTEPAADTLIDAPPSEVELRFDEPVEMVDNPVQVFGPGGERVDAGAVETADGGATLRVAVDAADRGTYTVAWRVTSEDSHTLSGSFVFHHGTRTGAVSVSDGGDTTTDIAGGVGRWLAMAGTLTAFGAAALALLRGFPGSAPDGPIAGPGGTAATPTPGDGSSGGPDARDTAHDPDRLVASPVGSTPSGESASPESAAAGGAVSTMAVSTAAEPDTTQPGTAPSAEATPTGATDGTPAGTAPGVLRALTMAGGLAGTTGAFLALVAVLADSAGRSLHESLGLVIDVAPDTRTGQLALLRIGLALAAAVAAAGWWRRSPAPALALAGGSLAAMTLAGHAWTAPDRGIAVTSDLAHLGAVGLWAGGLVALLTVLPLEDSPGRLRLATRFSAAALVAAVVVAASGTVSGWQQVRSLDNLTSTTYGQLLLAKVAGFAVLVALGWANRSRLVPLVARAIGPLQRSLRVEVLVAAAVLAVTAALVNEPPPRSEPANEPYEATATATSGEVLDATVDPATAGPNDIHLYFFAGSGSEPLAVDAVEVAASTSGVPARRLQVTPITTNHVTVAGASLPSSGTWTIEVTAVQAGEPLTFTFEVPIA